jgi:hypothetical protein
VPIVGKHIIHLFMPNSMDPFPYGKFYVDISYWVKKGIADGELYPYPESFLESLVSAIDKEILSFFRKNPAHYDDAVFTENLINKVFRSIQA